MNRLSGDIGRNDAVLVKEAQRGCAEALAELVARYQDRLYNACYRLCRNEADALDLAQTTFLRAIEALPRFEARASFYTWLFRIAVNLAMSQRRRRPVVPLAGAGCGEPAAPRERSAAASELERREAHGRVAAALAELEPEYRAALVLRDIEELDYATIAEILSVPIGTVKSRICRGRMLLRERLAARSTLDRADR